MGFKEIMSMVNKQQAVQFMNSLIAKNNRQLNGGVYLSPSQFTEAVNACLREIGIDANVSSNTANAVITRMERKSRIEFI